MSAATPAQPPFVYTVRVPYPDVDRMDFVHHSRYLIYFESARIELLRSTGTSYLEWEARGVLIPLTDCAVTYRRAARYDDVLRIETRLTELTRLRARFAYRTIREADGELLAEGSTSHFFMSGDGRPTRAPADLLALLTPYLHASE